MITKQELDEAIEECKAGKKTYQNCAKLATFYTLKSHIYPEDNINSVRSLPQTEVSEIIRTGDSENEFLQRINGKETRVVLRVISELMDIISITNPNLYANILRKIENG